MERVEPQPIAMVSLWLLVRARAMPYTSAYYITVDCKCMQIANDIAEEIPLLFHCGFLCSS